MGWHGATERLGRADPFGRYVRCINTRVIFKVRHSLGRRACERRWNIDIARHAYTRVHRGVKFTTPSYKDRAPNVGYCKSTTATDGISCYGSSMRSEPKMEIPCPVDVNA